MCGIAGELVLPGGGSGSAPDLAALQRMAAALRHRGPDEFGIYRDARCGLAHARLSIIDVKSGQQPLCNEDESIWISFNGEIFNYLELREELAALGHRFRTRSDTEVIVHAFEEWRSQCFSRFNGQFAVALWDSRREELVLARDRLGVRPLHLCTYGGRLRFASEAKAIFAADPAIPRALDPEGLRQTFCLWSPVAPRTAFAGVEELPPGHVRTHARSGAVREEIFWSPSFPESRAEGTPGLFAGSFADAAKAVRGALTRAVEQRMLRSDVPVGSYLSGGLDSSLVAALGREVKGERFQTYSLRFEDAEYDETPFQRQMAARLGTEHAEVVVSRRDIARVFPDVILHAERPILRTAPAPLSLLSRLVHESGIKVVLTGEGADEMFAGYDLFREARVRRFWARQPQSQWRPRLLERLYPYLSRSPVAQRAMAQKFFGRGLADSRKPGFSHEPRWSSAEALQRLFSRELKAASRADPRDSVLGELPPAFARWSDLAQDQYLEVRTLLAGYLLSSQGDRMLMQWSVEGRFPFLDAEVVELANSLPASYKLQGLDEKRVLKEISRGLVPDEIVARKKQPYRAPDALAFVGGPSAPPDWIEACLSERSLRDAGVFDPPTVLQLWKKCRATGGTGQFSNADNMGLVGVLSTQLLYEQMIRRAPGSLPALTLRTLVDRVHPQR
ncbi:MAG TPA: asparagine synthase (glutamine-hydrolyzing) [Myxococcales bacterium]|nr:asparagine synthase (glutamine-hydrolyzing) [Myxococcales bacterium]